MRVISITLMMILLLFMDGQYSKLNAPQKVNRSQDFSVYSDMSLNAMNFNNDYSVKSHDG